MSCIPRSSGSSTAPHDFRLELKRRYFDQKGIERDGIEVVVQESPPAAVARFIAPAERSG